jgi:hypothetical protein
LEKIQRRAVTMVSGLKGYSNEEKLLELGLPTLEERRHQAVIIPTFKMVRGIDRVDYNTWGKFLPLRRIHTDDISLGSDMLLLLLFLSYRRDTYY